MTKSSSSKTSSTASSPNDIKKQGATTTTRNAMKEKRGCIVFLSLAVGVLVVVCVIVGLSVSSSKSSASSGGGEDGSNSGSSKNIRGSSETNVVVNNTNASLVCPSQDEIFEISFEPQPQGSYEDGLQCNFEYRYIGISANDLKCTPLTTCSFEDNMWICTSAGIWCDPEIEYDANQAQCGDACPILIVDETNVVVNNTNASLVCPSQDEIFEISFEPQPEGSYEDGLQCNFEYRYTGISANDLKCTPLTTCSFEDNMWICTSAAIWCDPEIEYACKIRSCPRPNLIVDGNITDCPSDIKDWPELVGLCGSDAKAWLEQQYIDTDVCANLDVQIIDAQDPITEDYRLDRIRIFVEEEYGNDIVVEAPYVG
jgi:hypothetical protein